MQYIWDGKFDLTLFDGGAAGAGAGGDGGAGADAGATGQEDAAPVNPNRRQKRTNPLANVRYGIQPDQPAADGAQVNAAPGGEEQQPNLDEEWKTVKERFKEQFGRDTATIVKDRLKNSKQAETQMQKLAPILTAMAEKYGKGADDIDGIVAAYTDDDSLYEAEAMERGLPVSVVKQIRQLEADKQARDQQAQQDEQTRMIQQHIQKMATDFETVRAVFPQADLRTELQNPAFARLTSPEVGVSVNDAYWLIHRNEIEPQAMQIAAQMTQQKMSRAIQSGMSRPTENGSKATTPGLDIRDDPSKWSKQDRDEVKRRARMGEKVYL